MNRTLFGIFLIAHAIAHGGLASAPNPSEPESTPGSFFTHKNRSWLLKRFDFEQNLIRKLGFLLVIISVLGFILAGLGVQGVQGLSGIWVSLILVAAVPSLILLILFWHPWITLGVVIDVWLILMAAIFWRLT